MKIVIVGGVAGGASAAARIRRLDEAAEIVVLERSGYISYANCGLPYYVGGVITDKRALTLQTPESFLGRFRIDVRVNNEVEKIDPAAKSVTVRDLTNGRVYAEAYDRLVLAPGAKPALPDWPGIDNKHIFTLRTVEDAFRLRSFLEERQPRSAVLVGGGYIGLEMAENLREMGLEVTLVERQNQLLPALDADMAELLHTLLRQQGINLRLGCSVSGFAAGSVDGQVRTLLADQEPLQSDMVLVAVGVVSDTGLARQAGLELSDRGSIIVNDRMETSAADIYAVGDAVQVKHFVTGQAAFLPLAGPANKQGRIAADNICGGDSRYPGSLGTSVLKLFDWTVALCGLNERAAAARGLDYDKIVLAPGSHAAYYPGARAMTMKIIYEKGSLKLLGAQIVGGEGVDKRLDVLATAIYAGLPADKLKELDLAYAPPYSSAKDPVNMAGFMIENIAAGLVKQFHYDEVDKLPRDGSVTLLDVRTAEEYGQGHTDGFINIPLNELRAHLDELPKDKPVYVMCHTGLRSYIACRILSQSSFDCYNFSGGHSFYKAVVEDKQALREAYPCGVEK